MAVAMGSLQVCIMAGVSSVSGSRVVRLAGPSRVRCQAEQERSSSSSSSSASPTTPAAQSPPPPPPAPKAPNFRQALAFSGPAPERINGRLAMVGFVSAVGVELVSGNDLFTQLSVGGLPWFVLISGLFSAASLVPLLKGVSVDSVSGGLMSSSAEMWNGRIAMLGLVALALTEYLKGGPLV